MCEAAEHLEPAGEVIGRHEVGEVRPQLIVAYVVEAFDGRFLDGPVHPLDLTVVHGWLGLASRCSMLLPRKSCRKASDATNSHAVCVSALSTS